MLNHIVLMGRLTRDPELRRTGSGVAVASFTLAVDRDYAAQGAEKGRQDPEKSRCAHAAHRAGKCAHFPGASFQGLAVHGVDADRQAQGHKLHDFSEDKGFRGKRKPEQHIGQSARRNSVVPPGRVSGFCVGRGGGNGRGGRLGQGHGFLH